MPSWDKEKAAKYYQENKEKFRIARRRKYLEQKRLKEVNAGEGVSDKREKSIPANDKGTGKGHGTNVTNSTKVG